jgi:hypothetical protein
LFHLNSQTAVTCSDQELGQGTVVGNRDWNRIEAELEAALSANREHACRQAVDESSNRPKVPRTDAESILKHIEEALQKE